MGLQRQPKCSPSRKQPYNRTGSHSYNLRSPPLTPPLRDSPLSPLAPPPVHPSPSTPPLCDSPVHSSSQRPTRFRSISSSSSLSIILTTPSSSPSAPISPAQSHLLECKINTANDQITKLAEFLIDKVTTSRKERDEVALEAEKVKELVDHRSSEASRLWVFRDTVLRTWEELITCAMCAEPCIRPYLIQECKHTFCLRCLQKWFAECLHKDLRHVNLPDHLVARRNPPYTSQTLEEFYKAGVIYGGLPYTCPLCRVKVWDKPQEDQALTRVISTLAATFSPAMHESTDNGVGGDVGDVWAGVFIEYYPI